MARDEHKAAGFPWRLWLGVAGAAVLCASTAMAGLAVRHYAMTDAHFTLTRGEGDTIAIQGIHYASGAKVRGVFDEDYGRSVFAIPLADRRRRLLEIDWVEDASVTRVVPNRLLVRIRERRPVAFAVFRSGAMLVDAAGALFEVPAQADFSFPALLGLKKDETAVQRRARLDTFLRFEREMGYLAKDVSEVDVSNPGDLLVVTQAGGREAVLQLGERDFARRYQTFVSHYEEIHSQSPEVYRFDLRLDGRIVAR